MKTTLISCLTSFFFFIITGWLIYLTLEFINPPITNDGHRYMPIKSVLESVIISFFLSILFFIFIRKYFKKKNR